MNKAICLMSSEVKNLEVENLNKNGAKQGREINIAHRLAIKSIMQGYCRKDFYENDNLSLSRNLDSKPISKRGYMFGGRFLKRKVVEKTDQFSSTLGPADYFPEKELRKIKQGCLARALSKSKRFTNTVINLSSPGPAFYKKPSEFGCQSEIGTRNLSKGTIKHLKSLNLSNSSNKASRKIYCLSKYF